MYRFWLGDAVSTMVAWRSGAMRIPHLGSLALIASLTACSISPSDDGATPCTGKCDSAAGRALASLELNDVRTGESGDSQQFRLVGSLTDALYDVAEDGDSLAVELRLADGDADPSFRITTKIVYDADAIGGFISDDVDASGFLPWRYMIAHVQGSLRGGAEVDEYFAFEQGTLAGEPVGADWAPSPIARIGANQVTFDPDVPEQVLMFWAELDPALAPPPEQIHDGDKLSLELRLADGDADPNFAIRTTMTYDADAADAFVTDTVDVSAFLPWTVMKARVTGTLGGDTTVDRTFIMRIDDVYVP